MLNLLNKMGVSLLLPGGRKVTLSRLCVNKYFIRIVSVMSEFCVSSLLMFSILGQCPYGISTDMLQLGLVALYSSPKRVLLIKTANAM